MELVDKKKTTFKQLRNSNKQLQLHNITARCRTHLLCLRILRKSVIKQIRDIDNNSLGRGLCMETCEQIFIAALSVSAF